MNRSSWLVLAAAALLGCGGKVVFDGDAVALTPCDRACSRVVEACGEDPTACAAACQEITDKEQGTACGDLYDELARCITEATDDVVCGPGKNVPASCQSLFDEFSACGA